MSIHLSEPYASDLKYHSIQIKIEPNFIQTTFNGGQKTHKTQNFDFFDEKSISNYAKDYYSSLPLLEDIHTNENSVKIIPIILYQIFHIKTAMAHYVEKIRVVDDLDFQRITGQTAPDGGSYILIIYLKFDNWKILSSWHIIEKTLGMSNAKKWKLIKEIIDDESMAKDNCVNTLVYLIAIRSSVVHYYVSPFYFPTDVSTYLGFPYQSKNILNFYQSGFQLQFTTTNMQLFHHGREPLEEWCTVESKKYQFDVIASGPRMHYDTSSVAVIQKINNFSRILFKICHYMFIKKNFGKDTQTMWFAYKKKHPASHAEFVMMAGEYINFLDNYADVALSVDEEEELRVKTLQLYTTNKISNIPNVLDFNAHVYTKERYQLCLCLEYKSNCVPTNTIGTEDLNNFKTKVVNAINKYIINNNYELVVQFLQYDLLDNNELDCVFRINANPNGDDGVGNVNGRPTWLQVLSYFISIKTMVSYNNINYYANITPIIDINQLRSVTIESLYDSTYLRHSNGQSMFMVVVSTIFNTVKKTIDIFDRNIIDIGGLLRFAKTFVNDTTQWALLKKYVSNKNESSYQFEAMKTSVSNLSGQYANNKLGAQFIFQFGQLVAFVKCIIIYLDNVRETVNICSEKFYATGNCVLVLKADQLSTFFSRAENALATQLLNYIVQQCNANKALQCDKKIIMTEIIVPFTQATFFHHFQK